MAETDTRKDVAPYQTDTVLRIVAIVGAVMGIAFYIAVVVATWMWMAQDNQQALVTLQWLLATWCAISTICWIWLCFEAWRAEDEPV